MFDKDEQEISQIVETGIDAVLSGQATLEQYLAEHPEQASVLRPELEAALWLFSNKEQVSTRPGFISASRQRVLTRVKQESSGRDVKHSFFGFIWPQRFAYRWVAAILVIVVLFSGTGGVVSAAQGTLPGDGLYGVKRITEQFAYTVTLNETRKVELSSQFAKRRLNEVTALMEKGQYDLVEPTLKEFQRQVKRTVALLELVGENDNNNQAQGQADAALAKTTNDNLNQEAQFLDALMTNAPVEVLTSLKETHKVVQGGAAQALAVVVKIQKHSGIPTLTPEPSLTPTASTTPEPTGTDVPTLTPDTSSTLDVGNGKEPYPSLTPFPDGSFPQQPDLSATATNSANSEQDKDSKDKKPPKNDGNNGNNGNGNNGNGNGNGGNNGEPKNNPPPNSNSNSQSNSNSPPPSNQKPPKGGNK